MRGQRLPPGQDELVRSVIGTFYGVYNGLGFGFLERIYATALHHDLVAKGHHVRREAGVRISYKGRDIGWHRMDMVVDDQLIVEIKSGEHLALAASRQLLNYLKASRLEVGLLLHFGPEPRFERLVARNPTPLSPAP